MIEVGLSNIVKNYGFSRVLDELSLEIMTGEKVALVGRNGSGKSTILKLIAGEETAESGTISTRKGATIGYLQQIPTLPDETETTRDMLMQPFDTIFKTEARLRDLEKQMATAQDADSLERLMRQYAHHQSLFEAADGYAVEERTQRIITGFNLSDILDRPFCVLSGGQKTIVMLACTILRQPDILLLDEPTNHLDMKTLAWFESYLSSYKGTVILVSHDRYFLDKVAQKTIMLDRGTCRMFHGNYTFSQQEEERLLLLEFEQYKNQQKKIEAMKAAIKRYRLWFAMGDNEAFMKKAKELEKRLEKMEMIERPQMEKPAIPLHFAGERSGRDVLRLTDFSLGVGNLSLLQGVNLTLRYGEKACLLGDNGSGKTTFLRAILRAQPGESGMVFVAARAKVGYIPQEIRFEDDKASVLDTFRRESPCPEGMARGILAKFFFYGEHVFKRVSSLSGGEKVLLMLAILVQKEVNFLILDEPTNHIDIHTREMLEEALLAYEGTLLFITHDRYFVRKVATRILAIENRQIASYNGGYETYERDLLQRLGHGA